MKILQNLIKSRGADQKRSSAAQVYTAQKLCDLDKRVFDVVLKECNFEDAADHLITYLNKYYEASRPTQAPKRSDQLLRNIMKGLVVKSPFGSRRNNSKRDKERNQMDSPRGNEIVAKG
ncbi:voltage-dependent L-type calcium channel subunit beta-4-like [Bolinopsis microptera]|uniref:voltage-dependent L-type calcium channel subunit beta-4-like n=1 Tax=Bolinopsis microptera TaxID=2820187 RepID=UPI00307AD4A2